MRAIHPTGTRQRGHALLLAGALTLSGVAVATAQPNKGAASTNALQGFSQNRDQPVKIEATSLEVRDKSGIATFSGNVRVVQGDTTMRSRSLVVFYNRNNSEGATPAPAPAATGQPQQQQQISKLEAKGGVIVTQKDQTATGDAGLFDMRTNTVTLTGNVVVSQGRNVMRGERLVVDLNTGVSRVEGKGQGPVQLLIEQQPGGAGGSGPGLPRGFPQRN